VLPCALLLLTLLVRKLTPNFRNLDCQLDVVTLSTKCGTQPAHQVLWKSGLLGVRKGRDLVTQ
jgi:hypothetical protein